MRPVTQNPPLRVLTIPRLKSSKIRTISMPLSAKTRGRHSFCILHQHTQTPRIRTDLI